MPKKLETLWKANDAIKQLNRKVGSSLREYTYDELKKKDLEHVFFNAAQALHFGKTLTQEQLEQPLFVNNLISQ